MRVVSQEYPVQYQHQLLVHQGLKTLVQPLALAQPLQSEGQEHKCRVVLM